MGILKAAAFGVALWCADELDALTIEMLVGLIQDLNAATRWSGLPIAQDTTVTAAAMASGWMAGLPLRGGFADSRAEHDPWRYDARRMVEAGEADAVLWVSAFDDPLPDWLGAVPAIVLASPSRLATSPGAVALPVGQPGRDHDAILFDRASGTLVEAVAQAPTSLPSVADVLTRIAARLAP